MVTLIVFATYVVSAYIPQTAIIYLSAFSLMLGGSLIFLGFWGSDYAFSIALNELNQSKRRGKVKGRKGEVYVPFMKSYTATEWWNINWFVTSLGAFLIALGALTLGLYIGAAGF